MRWPETYDRLEQVTLGELETTQREIAETSQGLREPPQGVSQAEELARLDRYREYLLDDLQHIRERREAALRCLKLADDPSR
jgi:hypothetical protein